MHHHVHTENSSSPGVLYIVATPIGNLSDISARAQATLSAVAWIAAEDTRQTARLCQHLHITTPRLALHAYNEGQQLDKLITRLLAGESGVLVSDAGTPLIQDPGVRLVAAAHAAHIRVVPIPGACAAIAALSASGIETERFSFEGFLSAQASTRRKQLAIHQYSLYTHVYYEAPHRILATIADCIATFGEERLATIAREMTKIYEQIITASLREIQDYLASGNIPVKGEFVLIIAGASEAPPEVTPLTPLLTILLAEVPLRQAVDIAVKISGHPKKLVYDTALELKNILSEEQ